MMHQENADISRVWGYLHGELNEAQVEAMERDMAADATLRDTVSELRALSSQLREVMPDIAMDLQDLERQALEAWEDSSVGQRTADRASAESQGSLRPMAFWDWLKDLATTRPPAYAMGLAAAACLVLALGVQMRMADPIHWSSHVAVVQYRGHDAGAEGAYTPSELEALARRLKNTLESEYREAGTTGQKWDLSADLAELPGGVLLVKVEARPRGQENVHTTWREEFAEGSNDGIEELGIRIARELNR